MNSLDEIKNSLKEETFNYVTKSIVVDEEVWNKFSLLAKKSTLPKSYFTTLMLKAIIEELENKQ